MRTKTVGLIFLLVAVMSLGMAQSALGFGYAVPSPEDLFDLVPGAHGDKYWITVTICYEVNPCPYCLDGSLAGADDIALKDMSWGIRIDLGTKQSPNWQIYTDRASKDLIDCSRFPLPSQQEACEDIKSNLHPGSCTVPLCFVEDLDYEKIMVTTSIKNQIILPNFGDVPFVFSAAKGFVHEENESKPIILVIDVEMTIIK